MATSRWLLKKLSTVVRSDNYRNRSRPWEKVAEGATFLVNS